MKLRKLMLPAAAAALLCLLFAVTAYAETEGIFTYNVRNGQATVTRIATPNGDPVEIPETLGGYPVTALDNNGSLGDTLYIVSEVRIPKTVLSIGANTFSTARAEAFVVAEDNPNYSSFAGALLDKAQTTLIKFPPYSPAKTFTVPDTVTTVGAYAFSNVHYLETVLLPEGLTKVCDQAFAFTSALKNIRLPQSLREIERNCFGYNQAIEEIVIPKNVTSFGASAFTDCHNLRTVAILAEIDTLPQWAFDNNQSLKTVVLPATLTTVWTEAFVRTNGIERILFAGTQEQWDDVTVMENNGNFSEAGVVTDYPAETYFSLNVSENGGVVTLAGDAVLPDRAPEVYRPWDAYKETARTLVLEGDLKRIGANDFAGWEQLETVLISAPDAAVADGAFSGCPALTNVFFFGASPEGTRPFADCAGMNVFSTGPVRIDGAAGSVTVSYADGLLTYTGALTQNAYDFFDALSVFCRRFGRIDRLQVEELTFEGFSVYAVDPETGRQTPMESPLKNAELTAGVTDGGETRAVSFNELTEGLADGSITSFFLSIRDEAHEEGSKTQFNVIEELGRVLKRILRAIVTLLNKLFRLLNTFK